MSRVIKFRLWNIEEKKWINVDELSISCDGKYIQGGYFDMPINKYSVEQFTGLFDNKGNEIWEGDIVKEIGESPCFIVFQGGCFCKHEINGWDPMTEICPLSYDDEKTLKVIGTIHDKDNGL